MRAAFACPQTRADTVAVRLHKKLVRVVATENIEPHAIKLPALVPKSQRIATASVHPFREVVTVRQLAAEEVPIPINTRKREKSSQPLPENPPAKNYYISPEFQAPATDDASGDEPSFRYNGKESMLPFWAVDSVSGTKELMHLRDKHPNAGWPTNPNVDVTCIEFNVVTVGAIATERAALSYKVSIPALTNTRAIEKGERLVRHREKCAKAEDRNPKRHIGKINRTQQESGSGQSQSAAAEETQAGSLRWLRGYLNLWRASGWSQHDRGSGVT